MTQIVYNVSLALGVLLAAIGAGLQWGLAAGLMTAGALVIGLTLYGTELTRRSVTNPKG